MPHDRLTRTELTDRSIRVQVPLKVAFNLDQMQEVTAQVLNRLGCPQCHSGYDIRFDIARQFVVDDNLRVHSPVERFG